VTIDAPDEVLIGEDFEFEVTFKNNAGNPIGYAPYVDLYLPAWGADGNSPDSNSTSQKCDGITYVSAQAPFTSPPTVALPFASDSGMNTSAAPCPNSYSTHPFTGATIFNPTPQYQRVVVPLPFGSFDPTQPAIIIKVKAHLSDYADLGTPLTIYARGGFRYGADEKDNHPTDPLVESAPVSDQTTPTLLKIKKEYLGPEDEAVSGPNFVTYYPLKYKVTTDIADQQKIQNLIVTDKLPANLQFKGNVQVKIQGNNANVVTSCSATPGPFDVVISSPSLITPGGNLSVTLCSALTGSTSPDDVVVTFDFYIPNVDANGQIIIKKDCSNAPVAVKNDILAAGDWDPLDPRDPTPMSLPGTTVPINNNLTNVDHILNAKCLAIQKSVSMFHEFQGGAIGPTPGDTLKYELKFQVSDYFTIGKLSVTDFLADGQTLSGPVPTIKVTDLFGSTGVPSPFPAGTVTVTPNQLAAAAFCPVKLQNPQLGTIVSFNVSAAMNILPPAIPRHDAGMLTGGLAAGAPTNTPATGTIVFYATINDTFQLPVTNPHRFVDKHDPINNCVAIKGAVYGNVPRPNPLNALLNIPTMIVGSASDRSAVQTEIVHGDLKKTVWAVKRGNATLCGPANINALTTSCSNLPNAPEEVRPGDLVTFRIEKPLPSADTEALTIRDWLPLPIFNVSPSSFNNLPCSALPGAGIGCLGPSDTLHALVAPLKPIFTPDPGTNSIKFDYGDFNNTANTPLKIDLLFSYTVTNIPFADGLFMTNEAQECENNSFGGTFCQTSIAQVKVREPNLRIRKGVIATNNLAGQFSQPGSPGLAQAPVGATFSLSGVSGSVNSTNLLNLMDSNLTNVDANDIVTFAITIENVGGAPAFDVQVEDIIPNNAGNPSCFTIIPNTYQVKRGTGAIVVPLLYNIATTTSGGFTITSTPNLPIPINAFNPTTGQNIIIITFQAQLLGNIMPGCCDNKAEIKHYASQLNGPDFVSAGFTPRFDDTAQVCVNIIAKKCVVKTSEPHTVPNNSASGTPNAAIGELMRYQLYLRIPEGVSPFLSLTDYLPPGMTYMNDGTTKVALVFNNSGMTSTGAGLSGAGLNINGSSANCGTPTPTLQLPSVDISGGSSGGIFAPGVDPNFYFGIVTNNDNDNDDEFVIVEFNALVNNLPQNVVGSPNQDGAILPNSYDVFIGKAIMGQPKVPIATSNVANVVVVEPHLQITKTASPASVPPGGIVTFTVTTTNNGTADAFDVLLTDPSSSGISVMPNTVTFSSGCATGIVNTTTGDVSVPRIPVGCTVTVTLKAKVTANCPTGPVTNTAFATYTSLPATGTPIGLNNSTGSITPGASGATDGERQYKDSGSVTVPVLCTGSLTVTKIITNLTSFTPPAATVFPVNVSCTSSGPNVNLNLTAGAPTQTVNNIAVGSVCTVTEGALPPPIAHPACASLGWSTTPTYSPGQSVPISTPGANVTVLVQNTYQCNTGCAMPPANMVSWWPLDEQAGATVVKDIKNGHNGTPSGGALAAMNAQVGKVAGGLFVTGNFNVSVPDDPALKFATSNFSIDAWFGSGQPQLIGGIVDKLDIAAKTGYALYVQSNHLKLVMGNGTAFTTYTSVATVGITSGVTTWHHLAVTVDRANAVGIFYIDGVAGAPFSILPAGANISNTSPLLLGASRQTFAQCVCEFNLDEIEIFNTVVPPNDIKSIVQADRRGKCKATIAGLKFNDLNGNHVRDVGDLGLGNWTIKATDSSSNTQTTMTDSAGNYSFTVAAPGTYTVSEVFQTGWTQTAPTSGTYAVNVSSGQLVGNRDFGNRQLQQNQCDLKITKDMKPNPVVSGQQATATITVTNVGSGPCHGPTSVTESNPPGLLLASANVAGGSCVLGTGTCNYPPVIPVGVTIVFTYVFNVNAQPGAVFENCASLKNSEDKNPANNGICVPVKVNSKIVGPTIQKKVLRAILSSKPTTTNTAPQP
jgi:uncharacterized repeat protein (TIGR01451 family)/fimbrial isopeptide formation D2 family protein